MDLQVTFRNLTDEPIVAQIYRTKTQLILQPSCRLTTRLPKGELVLHHTRSRTDEDAPNSVFEKSPDLEEGRAFDSADVKIPLSTIFTGSWNVVHASKWRIFSFKVTRKCRQIVILRRRNLASFLADMPDHLPLSSLLLPGSHDSMAFYGWPIAQCQSDSTPLSTQLHSGIRVLDIRLAVVPHPSLRTVDRHKLIAYHGFWPQKTPFTSILNDLFTFLSSPIGSKETVVMSIKQEDYAVTPAPLFSKLVRDAIIHGPGGWDDSKIHAKTDKGMWFLENRIPKLGEVRGKVIMLSRFGGNGAGWENGLEGLGIHPTTWPDSAKNGFEWELKGTIVKTHDWYAIPSFLSIPEKVERATQNLISPSVPTGQPTLTITYFSAALFPLALPPVIAKGFGWPAWGIGVEGVNTKLGAWLLDKLAGSPVPDAAEQGVAIDDEKRSQTVSEEPRIRGWTFLDYFSEPEVDIVPLLVECNFRGRKEGEEGW